MLNLVEGSLLQQQCSCAGLIKAKITQKYWAPEFPLLSAVPLGLPFPCPHRCETLCLLLCSLDCANSQGRKCQ